MDVVRDSEVEGILARKRHKELIGAINTLVTEFQQKEPDQGGDTIKQAISQHIQTVEKLVSTLSNLPKPEKPVINIETNNDTIIASLNDIADRISASLSALKQSVPAVVDTRPREWTFTVTRNFLGVIETITAKAK